jgi:hypothetical protein
VLAPPWPGGPEAAPGVPRTHALALVSLAALQAVAMRLGSGCAGRSAG